MTTLENILAGDFGSFAGRFGGSKHSMDCAKLCTEIKIKFTIDNLKEIENYEPWGDDHSDNLYLTMKFIKSKREELEKMIETLEQ